MIRIRYHGRTGNRLFQYLAALRLAERCQVPIENPPQIDWLPVRAPKFQERKAKEFRLVTDTNFAEILADGAVVRYTLDGYFQYLQPPDRALVERYLPVYRGPKNRDDVVVHLRLDDYQAEGHNSRVIDYRWYQRILDRLRFRRLYIVLDPKGVLRAKNGRAKVKRLERRYLEHFEKYNPTLIQGTPGSDFRFIQSFDTILASNSTFCYFACLLTDSKHIYTVDDFQPGWAYNAPFRVPGATRITHQPLDLNDVH